MSKDILKSDKVVSRTVVVTGASKGIGRSIALNLAEKGFRLVLCARSKRALIELATQIEKSNQEVIVAAVDLRDASQVKEMVQQTIRRYGSLDILVNAAGGIDTFGELDSLEFDDWEKAFKLNVMTVVHTVKYALPFLKKSESSRIINISSIVGIEPGHYNPHYSACKAAVINLSKYLANTLAKDKILVNVIAAGPIHDTNLWEKNVAHIAKLRGVSISQAQEYLKEQEQKKIPLGRLGEAQDVASLVAFLCSDEASWITGSCFHVDGGKLKIMH